MKIFLYLNVQLMAYVQKERVTNMARPRKYTFPLSDLEGFEKIRLELESNPELDGFDIEKRSYNPETTQAVIYRTT